MRRRRSMVLLAAAILLSCTGCVGAVTPQATPIAMRLVDIQSGTVRLSLNQVIELDIGDSQARYTAEIADERIVAVVQRRDETAGRFEPEIVPLHVGNTQVALISSIPGEQVIGFHVVVTRDGSGFSR